MQGLNEEKTSLAILLFPLFCCGMPGSQGYIELPMPKLIVQHESVNMHSVYIQPFASLPLPFKLALCISYLGKQCAV